jgi:suppressor of tumorigenicity protein 13
MEEEDTSGEPAFPPLYESGEDFDKAGDLKQEAADLSSSGNWEGALEKYTAAVLAAPPSALLYANRANTLLKLGRPRAAERDCNEALKENPDSAKALRIRGKARKALGNWEDALHDLSASQQIDFDDGTVDDLKELTQMRIEHEIADASERNLQEERLRKKATDIKKAQEDAKREAAEEARRSGPGGMPGGFGGMPGGMAGMPGMGGMPGGMEGMEGLMGAFMNDPEFLAAMEKPKVKSAFQDLMSGPGGPMGLMANPAKLQEMMADPDVGPVLQKLMSKIMGGAGGMPGGGGTSHNDDDDGIPDLDDMGGDVDLDDLPDLE